MESKRYRKIMKFVSSYTNDPYFSIKGIINKYGENIPEITQKPVLSQYGLPDDIDAILKVMEEKYNKKRSLIHLMVFIAAMLAAFIYGYNKYGTFEMGIGSTIAALIAYGIFFAVILDGKFEYRKNTELHKKYFEYEKQLAFYNYWLQMKSINYWMNLDGHEFEEAVAMVYRKQGYDAKVSRHGGDGGIDIILTKADKKIAVQCKAHNKAVSPSVVRDLFGTMNHFGFPEGILASRNGFTVGVYEFVKDKPIQLINLNDLLEMTS